MSLFAVIRPSLGNRDVLILLLPVVTALSSDYQFAVNLLSVCNHFSQNSTKQKTTRHLYNELFQ